MKQLYGKNTARQGQGTVLGLPGACKIHGSHDIEQFSLELQKAATQLHDFARLNSPAQSTPE